MQNAFAVELKLLPMAQTVLKYTDDFAHLGVNLINPLIEEIVQILYQYVALCVLF